MIIELLIGFLITISCVFLGILILVRTIDEIALRIDHKRLCRLLKDGNPLLEKLVWEIKKRRIVLIPFGLLELVEKLSPKKIFRMVAITHLHKKKIKLPHFFHKYSGATDQK